MLKKIIISLALVFTITSYSQGATNGIIGSLYGNDTTSVSNPDVFQFPELKAFISATGYGRYAGVGAPERTVYNVSNSNSIGSGSLADACSQPDREVTFFGFSGDIPIGGNTETCKSNTRLHGQTGNVAFVSDQADPVEGGLFRLSGNDGMSRYIRIRRKGEQAGSNAGGGGFLSGDNYIFDHMTYGAMSDDLIGAANSGGANATWQYCLFYKSVPKTTSARGTGKGALFYNDLRTLSLAYSVFAHVGSRTPAFKAYQLESKFEMKNNIIYNFSSQGGSISVNNGAGTATEAQKTGNVLFNMIGNKYIPGPNQYAGRYSMNISSHVQVYLKDNLGQHRTSTSQPEFDLIGNGGTSPGDASKQVFAPFIMNYTVNDAIPLDSLENKILPKVGPYIYRDSFDTQIINEVITRTGETYNPADPETFIYPTLGPGPAFTDSNNNWIDDDFETEHGLTGDGTNVTVDWIINGEAWENNTGWIDRDVYFGVLANDFELYKEQMGW